MLIHFLSFNKWIYRLLVAAPFMTKYYRDCVFPDLVVVVEQPQGVGAVLVPVDAHHGLGGGCQRVLQVGPPCLVFAGVGTPHRRVGALVGDDHHQALAGGYTQTF